MRCAGRQGWQAAASHPPAVRGRLPGNIPLLWILSSRQPSTPWKQVGWGRSGGGGQAAVGHTLSHISGPAQPQGRVHDAPVKGDWGGGAAAVLPHAQVSPPPGVGRCWATLSLWCRSAAGCPAGGGWRLPPASSCCLMLLSVSSWGLCSVPGSVTMTPGERLCRLLLLLP
jgi:hypothetical protein